MHAHVQLSHHAVVVLFVQSKMCEVRYYVVYSNHTAKCLNMPAITNGIISYTPHRYVSSGLRDGLRYTGTTVTYSCSSGYQLVGGSSLRACGPDGTWNGTEPSCSK